MRGRDAVSAAGAAGVARAVDAVAGMEVRETWPGIGVAVVADAPFGRVALIRARPRTAVARMVRVCRTRAPWGRGTATVDGAR